MSSIIDTEAWCAGTWCGLKENAMGASFEEKSVWIQLAGTVLGLGAYFVIAGRMMSAGIMELPAYVPLFVAAVGRWSFCWSRGM